MCICFPCIKKRWHTVRWAFHDVDYRKGICPVAEKLHDETFVGLEMCAQELSDEDIDLIATAFRKVWNGLESLR